MKNGMMIETVDEAFDFIQDVIYCAERPNDKNDKSFYEKLKQAKFIYDKEMSEKEKSLLNSLCLENYYMKLNLSELFQQFMVEKNKNALTDEMITKLNYTIEHLIEHGQKEEWTHRKAYVLTNGRGKRIFYLIFGNTVWLCATRNKLAPLMVYTVKGETSLNENPEGVLAIAEELGVFNEWKETQ